MTVDEHENLVIDIYLMEQRVKVTLGTWAEPARPTPTPPRIIVQYIDPCNSRRIVSMFRLFLDHLPEAGRFYRRPLLNKPDGKITFRI